MKKLLIILLFPVICQAQFKTVPDSLRCITPTQVNKQIENAFTIQQQDKSLLYLDSANTSLMYVIKELNQANDFCHSQVNLHLLRNSNLQGDKEYLESELMLANSKITMQKVLLYIVGGAGVISTGYFIIH